MTIKPINQLRPAAGEVPYSKLYLWPEERRAINWAATKCGMSFHDFMVAGGIELLRRVVTDGARAGNVPQNVAELLSEKHP